MIAALHPAAQIYFAATRKLARQTELLEKGILMNQITTHSMLSQISLGAIVLSGDAETVHSLGIRMCDFAFSTAAVAQLFEGDEWYHQVGIDLGSPALAEAD